MMKKASYGSEAVGRFFHLWNENLLALLDFKM